MTEQLPSDVSDDTISIKTETEDSSVIRSIVGFSEDLPGVFGNKFHYSVGSCPDINVGNVHEITYREEMYGDQGTIGWFDVWVEPMGQLFATVNEKAVAEVIYKQPGQDDEQSTNT